VLCVVVCHFSRMAGMAPDAWSFLFGLGRFGVLLFFFHTSFVLMQSLDVSRGAYWALRFYVRRFSDLSVGITVRCTCGCLGNAFRSLEPA